MKTQPLNTNAQIYRQQMREHSGAITKDAGRRCPICERPLHAHAAPPKVRAPRAWPRVAPLELLATAVGSVFVFVLRGCGVRRAKR